ncbi:class I SAM-dependent methyltransferase [Limibaculum sp. M0105]|uniref:Class I SAM-dependent methyltransferase n=1 Tax=Thermohalobaculum xanthum TaxID=2753746 RepID=A0A8J7M875_9RHOB|nr:class I SAM-dependent methyltransferase [Thermohalobaculum xanthum]MBK0400384.1 class I SAM-dependent methyltransferase [Thermohalobaculum xanthum]
MTILYYAHQLVNMLIGSLGLRVERKYPRMPDAPTVPDFLLADCRVLSGREQLLELLPRGGIAAEIGVADGSFSEAILSINQPKRLYLVDAWATARYRAALDHVKVRFSREIEAGTIVIERGMSLDAMQKIPNGSLDWVYIDTNHDFFTTRKELSIAERIVKSNGLIAGHDFCNGNPYKALPYGVIPAVCDFCVERNWAMAYLALSPNGHFSFCLRKSDRSAADGSG